MRTLKGIVIHRAETDFASYHRVIDFDGNVLFQRHDAEVAPACKDFNDLTLNVAVRGDFAPGEPGVHWTPTDTQVVALVALVNAWRAAYGDLWVCGHSDLGARGTAFPEKLTAAHACPGSRLNLEQLRIENGWPGLPAGA